MNYDNSKKFYPKKLIAQLQIGFALSIISFLNIKYMYLYILISILLILKNINFYNAVNMNKID